MRIVRARIFTGIAIVLAAVLVGRYLLNPERRIFSMVVKNQEEYQKAAVQLLEMGEEPKLGGVDRVVVSQGDHMMVDFYVTGFGIAPSSTYYGFYYSPDDVPLAYPNADAALTQYERNSWEWSANGDNRGVTKKIADCWYYYEASF